MDSKVESLLERCISCQPLNPQKQVWDTINIYDLFPLLNNSYLLATTDQISKYFDPKIVRTIRTSVFVIPSKNYCGLRKLYQATVLQSNHSKSKIL